MKLRFYLNLVGKRSAISLKELADEFTVVTRRTNGGVSMMTRAFRLGRDEVTSLLEFAIQGEQRQ